MKIILASPRGFCAGVERAISIVEKALDRYGSPVYVRHEIVHNKIVVSRLKKKGAVFVEEVDAVPNNSVVIFSAHGVAKDVVKKARERSLRAIDATCPLVKRVHRLVDVHDKLGREIILIGHKGHPEVVGTMGQLAPGRVVCVGSVNDVRKLKMQHIDKVAYVTQTTLSLDETQVIIDALKGRFPVITGPEDGDRCYATTNRQHAVKAIARMVDIVVIVGSANSSNSNRLREIASGVSGVSAYLVDAAADLRSEWFNNVKRIGLSSGASAPEDIVQDIIKWLQEKYQDCSLHEHIAEKESIRFSLPSELQ